MMLATAARRTGLAALVTVVSLAMASQAWAQTSECPNASIRGRARPAIVPSTLMRVIDNPGASVDELQGVRRDCQEILTGSQNGSVDALMCVARAQVKLADRDVDAATNYGYARCHAYRAGRLASGEARSRANAVRAEALVGLMRVNAGSADSYSQELLRDDVHNSAAALPVHRAVAQMYVNRNNATAALREARTHLTGADRALRLIDIANMPGGDSNLLDEAYGADQASVATNSALGAAYFRRQDWARAADRLRFATQSGRTPEPGYESLQLDAFYYLSVIQAANIGYGTPSEAKDSADRAGVTPYAMRQACLSRLIVGRDEVYQTLRLANNQVVPQPGTVTNGYERCNRLSSTPEGQLLIGMYWLRYAQHLPAVPPNRTDPRRERWNTAIDNATRAFTNGETQLGGSQAEINWDWPRQQRKPKLIDMLRFGQDLASYYDTVCGGSRARIDSRAREVYEVFATYRVVGPSTWRCDTNLP